MPIEAYTEAIESARVEAERDFGLVLRWIYDIPGEFGLPAADATLDYALDHRPEGLVAFGLGGPETACPGRSSSRTSTRPARPGCTACRTPARPPARRRSGTRSRLLGAERIGHGTSSAQDPALLRHLAETGIPLEVCPSSNIATRAVATLEEHPIRAFRDAGVTVTVNSDDPPMFGTTLNREYEIAADLLDLDEAGVADLARTAVRESFAPDDVRARLLGEIDAYVAGEPAQPGR